MAPGVDQDWGPTVRQRAGRFRALRVLALVLVVVLLLTVAGALWATSRIPRIDVDGLAASSRPMHVLVVGSDSREGLTEEQRQDFGGGPEDDGRTDTIFVMTVRGGDVALLAFPRDLWVARCDGTVGRINAAEAIDGPSCLVRTVRDLSGIDVQHYVRVTFGGFVDIVDAVGGVELCLEEAISDRDAHIDLPAGCQVLEGRDALGYVRVRKIDDDLQRIQRQQQFLRALASEIAAPGTLFNPVRMLRLSNEAGDALAVSRGTGVLALGRLALGARGLASGNVATHTVPVDPHRTGGGADVLLVREGEAEALFSRFRDGSILDEVGQDGDEEVQVSPADVEVVVLNGAGVSGLAGRVGDQLADRGYQVVDVGNADPVERSVVRHPPGMEAEARLVAGDAPGDPTTESRDDVDTVTLVLGSDAGDA